MDSLIAMVLTMQAVNQDSPKTFGDNYAGMKSNASSGIHIKSSSKITTRITQLEDAVDRFKHMEGLPSRSQHLLPKIHKVTLLIF